MTRRPGEALRRHGSQIVIGVLWTALVAWLDAAFLWWLAPIVVSLILSAPVSVITSRTGLGLAARRCKLFLIPEEYAPPTELANTDRYQQQNQANALREGFLVAVVDPLYNALVCAMARARHARWCRPRSTCASSVWRRYWRRGRRLRRARRRAGACSTIPMAWRCCTAMCGTTRQVPTGWRAIGRSTPRRSSPGAGQRELKSQRHAVRKPHGAADQSSRVSTSSSSISK